MTQHSALIGHTPKRTPQSEPIPGSTQVPNSAGGYTWGVDLWQRIQRFLILGAEGGTYYIGQKQLVTENTEALDAAVKEDGKRLVKLIIEISDSGRAPSNDPALFALAYAAKKGNDGVRYLALSELPRVARTGTHLFHFASYVKALGGFGRGTRRAIADWYRRDVDQVAYQAVKYRQRDGWTHRDLLRLSHAKPDSRAQDDLFEWIVKGMPLDLHFSEIALPQIAEAYKAAQRAETPAISAKLIRDHGLPREAIQTDHLNDLDVWHALLEKMPYTATLRNLATMTRIGVLEPGSEATRKVATFISDKDMIAKSRVHPIAILAAMKTYQQGYSMRGSNSWNAIRNIVDALDSAFYSAFGNVDPTGKRILLALDVSGSMSCPVAGVEGLSAREASAAMALVTANVESNYEIVGFTSGGGGFSYRSAELTELDISPRQRLDDAVRAISGLPFGGTDCALPMTWANARNRQFDAFAILTDNETWAGDIQPSQALVEYRKMSGIDSRLAVIGTASNGFSIADPDDAGMLDVVGFDTATPNIISEFISGTL